MRPDRPRAWANWAMVPPGRSVLIRRKVLLPLSWPHQGFSPGGNEGCDRSLGVQLPPLDGWSLRPLLATVSEYIGTSLVSRWNFSRNRSSRSARSMGPFIISLLTASPAFALIW